MVGSKKVLTEVIVPLYLPHPSLYPVIQRFFDTLREHYPELYKNLIVIDDCSPLTIPHTWPLTYRQESNVGFTKNVNTGLQMSRADKIIICNDDLIIKRGDFDWIEDLEGLTIVSPRDTASSPDDRFGSIWGMTREVLDKVGYLNERYAHFWSDLNYYNRAKEAGVKIVKRNDIIVEHVESATYKLLGNKDELLEADRQRFFD